MSWLFEAISEPGRGRLVNEDALLVDGRVLQGRGISRGALAPSARVAVADGVGSGHDPARASRGLLGLLKATPGAGFTHASACWQALRGLDQSFRALDPPDMASTLVGARVEDDVATFFNVGDSRAYIASAAGLERVSEDHSVVAGMVADGDLQPHEAQHAGGILRAITAQFLSGGPERRFVARVTRRRIADVHRVLLCSDGLTECLDDDLLALWMRREDADLRALLRLARARGATDDISAILLTRRT